MQFEQIMQIARMQVSFHTNYKNASLLDTLWIAYTKYHPIEATQIDNLFQSIQTEIHQLSRKKKNIICRYIADLCIIHERSAFLEGIRAGIQFSDELKTELPPVREKA